MNIFDYMEKHGHQQLVFCCDKMSGLRAIIGIHDTTLGPALGGCRMWPYVNEEDAIIDVLRLSKGMSYKNAAMGLNLGGGKTVVLGDPRHDKSEELFRALGRFIEGLGGRYITAEDVGTTLEDIEWIHQETQYVAGLPEKSGDPSPATAYGVFQGMRACAQAVFGERSLRGRKVAVQGLGHVGQHLCRLLREDGTELIVTDIDPERVEYAVAEFGARAVEPKEIYDLECDVFAPCALGAVINDDTITRLKCKIVCGSANNQLKEPAHGDRLHHMGILYAPDYLVNGGGVINVSHEFHPAGYDKERAYAQIATIYDKIARVIAISKERNIPTYQAADWLAEDRINKVGHLATHIRLPH